MKITIVTAVLLWSFILLGTSEAIIYQYVDDKGDTHYTNDPSSVPTDKLDQLTEIEETESEGTPAPEYSGPIYPLLQNQPSAEELKEQREQKQEKEQLEAEYASLLKEKEAMDNDKSFQTRRNKRKYQNRPYILELIAREAEINKRLNDIDRQLKAY